MTNLLLAFSHFMLCPTDHLPQNSPHSQTGGENQSTLIETRNTLIHTDINRSTFTKSNLSDLARRKPVSQPGLPGCPEAISDLIQDSAPVYSHIHPTATTATNM